MAKAGAIPKFVNLLRSESINVAEQSVWALGNIAGDGATTRDEVLRYNTAEVLLEILQQNQPVCPPPPFLSAWDSVNWNFFFTVENFPDFIFA